MSAEEITIDVGAARSKQSLHEMFAAVLGFPEYYGMNWDAFWDCVRDAEQSSMPPHLVLKGISELERRLPDDARKLRDIVRDLSKERPDLKVSLHG
jgi:RNAse (barnase) inhibitor barstar